MDIRDTLVRYGYLLSKRYNWKQKQLFTKHIGDEFQKMGYEVRGVLSDQKKNPAMNLVVGDLAKAKKIVIAHYDTPKRLFISTKYYPLNEYKSFKAKEIAANIPFLLIFMFGTAVIYLCRDFFRFTGFNVETLLSCLIVLVFGLFSFLFSAGPANPFNMQRNSAAVVAVIALAEKLKKKKDIAFVLTDRELNNHAGDHMVQQALPTTLKDRTVLHLHCIGKGPAVGIGFEEANLGLATKLESIFKGKHQTLLKSMSEKEIKLHSLGFYPKAITVSSGEVVEDEILVRDTSTRKDNSVDLEFFESLIEGLETYLKS